MKATVAGQASSFTSWVRMVRARRRISFGDGSYSTPVWSPRGDLIAFTKQSGGKFSIGVMKTGRFG